MYVGVLRGRGATVYILAIQQVLLVVVVWGMHESMTDTSCLQLGMEPQLCGAGIDGVAA